jgi:hypothetical protein
MCCWQAFHGDVDGDAKRELFEVDATELVI